MTNSFTLLREGSGANVFPMELVHGKVDDDAPAETGDHRSPELSWAVRI